LSRARIDRSKLSSLASPSACSPFLAVRWTLCRNNRRLTTTTTVYQQSDIVVLAAAAAGSHDVRNGRDRAVSIPEHSSRCRPMQTNIKATRIKRTSNRWRTFAVVRSTMKLQRGVRARHFRLAAYSLIVIVNVTCVGTYAVIYRLTYDST